MIPQGPCYFRECELQAVSFQSYWFGPGIVLYKKHHGLDQADRMRENFQPQAEGKWDCSQPGDRQPRQGSERDKCHNPEACGPEPLPIINTHGNIDQNKLDRRMYGRSCYTRPSCQTERPPSLGELPEVHVMRLIGLRLASQQSD